MRRDTARAAFDIIIVIRTGQSYTVVSRAPVLSRRPCGFFRVFFFLRFFCFVDFFYSLSTTAFLRDVWRAQGASPCSLKRIRRAWPRYTRPSLAGDKCALQEFRDRNKVGFRTRRYGIAFTRFYSNTARSVQTAFRTERYARHDYIAPKTFRFPVRPFVRSVRWRAYPRWPAEKGSGWPRPPAPRTAGSATTNPNCSGTSSSTRPATSSTGTCTSSTT